jgi:hypothetical protein
VTSVALIAFAAVPRHGWLMSPRDKPHRDELDDSFIVLDNQNLHPAGFAERRDDKKLERSHPTGSSCRPSEALLEILPNPDIGCLAEEDGEIVPPRTGR